MNKVPLIIQDIRNATEETFYVTQNKQVVLDIGQPRSKMSLERVTVDTGAYGVVVTIKPRGTGQGSLIIQRLLTRRMLSTPADTARRLLRGRRTSSTKRQKESTGPSMSRLSGKPKP
jgi:hypothetical protein